VIFALTILFMVGMSIQSAHKKKLRLAARARFSGRGHYTAADYPISAVKAREKHRGPSAELLEIRLKRQRRAIIREVCAGLEFEGDFSRLEIKAMTQRIALKLRGQRLEFDDLFARTLNELKMATNQ
jgi:hypothetical protein